ncbi:MAG: hypothetical protein AAF655_20845 [Bacteroidota bacterium]
MKHLLIVLTILFFTSCKDTTNSISIYLDSGLEESLNYGLDRLKNQLEEKGKTVFLTEEPQYAQLLVHLMDSDSKDDGFTLEKSGRTISLHARSSRGLLYGILDIAEQLKKGKSWNGIEEKDVKAHYSFRAIKFNLPWFSYREGENLSLHYDTCKDLTFWESFLDMMVENKFNVLSLWNLHPYMYMVQSEKFPEAVSFSDQEMAEWEKFWKSIFHMAKERGIDPFIFNWNIFVSEEFSKAYNVADYSRDSGFFGDGETNENIEEYTREMVAKTIDTYEDIAGIGITLGERMGGMDSEMRRDWIDRTMIKGIKQANRKVKLFYRAPLSAGTTSHGTVSKATEVITREAIENIGLEDEVLLGFKFNWSHGHSSPKLSIVHGGILTETYWKPKPKNYKGVYTIRNEDFFALRWAQPEFIRSFIRHNSQNYITGVIIGSETYIPAKDYITKEEFRSWNYAFEKQWLFYKVWGNLLYNGNTPNSYFAEALAEKYGIDNTTELMEAWELASQNANSFASFYRGEWDGTLYTEGMTREEGQFITVDKLISHPVLDSTYVNISDFVEGLFTEDQLTPLQFADTMEQKSLTASEIAQSIITANPENELLKIETNDIIAWAHLGLYIADKVRGGAALQKYRKHGDIDDQHAAIGHLESALQHWKSYVETMELYNEQMIPHQFDSEFSFRKHIKDATFDIEIAKK